MMNLTDWINRWWPHLPKQARSEYMSVVFPHNLVQPAPSDASEAHVQSQVRLAASRDYGAPLWRNNNGAMTDDSGRHVRFGLGNESERLSRKWKSADLIGIKPVEVTPAHVGKTLGVFLAVEMKAPGWKLQASDKTAQAQANFLNSVTTFGGIAGFAQSEDDFKRMMG